jgi:hypothetical protein
MFSSSVIFSLLFLSFGKKTKRAGIGFSFERGRREFWLLDVWVARVDGGTELW